MHPLCYWRRTGLLLFVFAPAFCGAADGPAALPVEHEDRLIADAADGKLDRVSLVEAALIAGGAAHEGEVARACAALDRSCQSIAKQIGRGFTGEQRAGLVLRWLHEKILRGAYQQECSALVRTLETGDFNCVTSTVLYCYLAGLCGVDARPAAVPGHVFATVPMDGGRTLRVETTCPNRGTSTAAYGPAVFEIRTGRHRKLSEVQLVAKVFYNRGVSLLAQKQFRDAITRLHLAAQLDPADDAARENLLAAVNNWALACCRAGRFRQATDLLAFGRRLNPDYALFDVNDLHIHYRWVAWLCERHRFAEAIDVLQRGHRRRPAAALFTAGRYAVYEQWIRSLQERGRTAEASEIARELEPPAGIVD